MYSPLSPPALKQSDSKVNWGNLQRTTETLAIAKFTENSDGCSLIITSDVNGANRLHRELRFFMGPEQTPILHFPDWETLAFDHFSPHEDIISNRLATLHKASHLKNGIIIAALPTLLQRTLPRHHLAAHAFILQKGDKIRIDKLNVQLVQAGYHHVDAVREHGEFAVRGSIWDVFPTGSDSPFRIELFDDDIETIRSFDPETQLSKQQFDHIELLPAREYPLTDDAITHFRQQFRSQFSGNPRDCAIYEAISNGKPFPGTEYYLPLFYEQLDTFFDYLPEHCTVFIPNDIQEKFIKNWGDIEKRYEQLRYDRTRPLCTPSQLYLNQAQFFAKLKSHMQVRVSDELLDDKFGNYNFSRASLPNIQIESKEKQPLNKLKAFLDNVNYPILFTAESSGRRETLLDLLREIHITPHAIDSWTDFIATNSAQATHAICVAPLDHGLVLDDPELALIPEASLFGEQVMQRRLRNKQQTDVANLIHSLAELKIDAPVVHIQYGIARYKGLEVIETGDVKAEYLTLEYADKDKVYVPINSLHMISRYTGVDADHAKPNKLGSNKWSRTKSIALKQIHDVAAELLKLYSEREASIGHAFPQPGADYRQFRADFPFEETPDQETTIDSVIGDMTRPRSMDRLVCGDVGFGKTEVAMQAAFYAANSGKQVAILTPTTLLAEQHYHNFMDRFADWPISIGILSRLQPKKAQTEALAGLKNGKVDIVIGTHKLLQEDIKFKDLGLLIIDEEHRFGVRQKEKIRQLRATVDILALTATPIPRTLNMALSGTRDLSIISTPPLRRLSIKTFLHDNNKAIIYEAISREIMRGGQVYFLHNDVATIAATAQRLRGIIPEARIAIAHGQMRERELEKVMSDFYHQRCNVLVCTTIIESGIDIPSANTIIIERADKFGLSQLHQLRGRVGRSHHQAYAYLLVPDKKSITSDANKRLDAITTFEDLGAGFMLATHDLEIRGAGELLGEEQSGHIEAIGFSLYMELLDEAVKALKEGRDPDCNIDGEKTNIEVDLHISALLPDDYVGDIGLRLTLYKRLSQCTSNEEIQQFKAELVDRFGLLPPEAHNLIDTSELKLLAQRVGLKKVDLHKKYGYLHFNAKPNINPQALVKLIQTQSDTYTIQGQDKLRITFSNDNRVTITKETLLQLAN